MRASAVLVSSEDGRVDGGIFVVRIIRRSLEKLLPNAAHGPTGIPPVCVTPTTELFWQITPRRTDAELPDHREKTIAKMDVAPDRAGTTRK